MSPGERWVTCIVDERAHAIARYDLDGGRGRYRARCGGNVPVRPVLPRSVCGMCGVCARTHAAGLDELTRRAELTRAGRVR